MTAPIPLLRACDCVLIATGSNQSGPWGDPGQTLERALEELKTCGVELIARSAVFKTPPVGGGNQPSYLNQVFAVATPLGPVRLLHLLKTLERAAGRRPRGRWTARPLDMDIVAYKGLTIGWPRRRPGSITLPHPECHNRAFVLLPITEISPWWYHQTMGARGCQLLARRLALDARLIAAMTARHRSKIAA